MCEELAKLRWGMPTPLERVKGNADSGRTNIRNPQYGHWQQYVGIEHRCGVPVTSFAEPSPTPGDKDPETGIQRNFWFALSQDRPHFFFAGFWTRWQGVRKVKEGPGDHELYAFMTTKPNALIAPIHEKAMPVILTTREEARHLADTAMVGSETAAAVVGRRRFVMSRSRPHRSKFRCRRLHNARCFESIPMSDELIRLPGAMEPVTRPGIQHHRREHPGCGKNAGWGFAKPRKPSHWYCFEDRADGEVFL